MKNQCRILMIDKKKLFVNLQTIVLLVLTALFNTGCYPATLAPSEDNLRSKQLAPPSGKALVYFYLDYSVHDLIDVSVSLNGYGGRISKYTYMLWEVFPGEYLLAFDSSKEQELEIKCEANQIYYYHNVYKSVFSQKLTQASDATGRAKINELALVKWFKDVPAPLKTNVTSGEKVAADFAEPAEPKKAEEPAQVSPDEALALLEVKIDKVSDESRTFYDPMGRPIATVPRCVFSPGEYIRSSLIKAKFRIASEDMKETPDATLAVRYQEKSKRLGLGSPKTFFLSYELIHRTQGKIFEGGVGPQGCDTQEQLENHPQFRDIGLLIRDAFIRSEAETTTAEDTRNETAEDEEAVSTAQQADDSDSQSASALPVQSEQANLEELREQLEVKGVEQLIEEIKSDSSAGVEKIRLLGRMKDERLVKPLIVNFLKEESQPEEVRRAAARALGQIGDSAAVEPLIDVLKTDPNSSVRFAATVSLGLIGDPNAVDTLIDVLKHGSEESARGISVAGAAAVAIGRIGDPRAVEPLITIVDESPDNTDSERRSTISILDPWSRRRRNAISALGALGGRRASETLKRLLKDDKDEWTRSSAAEALGQINDPSAVESLLQSVKQDPEDIVKRSSLSALAEIGGARVAEILASFLDLEDAELRFKAAAYLLDFEDSKARESRAKALRILEEQSYIIETTHYDKYNRPSHVSLENIKGESVAQIQNEFHEYNNTLLKRQVTRRGIAGDVIRVTDCDNYGRPQNLMYLCLDIKGDLIEKDGKPVLVRSFNAEQKSHTELSYFGLSRRLLSQERKIHTCENCEEKTGIKNCRRVW